jgi:hypothetical protein
MIESVNAIVSTDSPAAQDASVNARPATQPATSPAPAQPTGGELKPTTRLLIDQDKTTGVFIYRIVDAINGRVLAEIPRESIDQFKDSQDYTAGDLVSTTV